MSKARRARSGLLLLLLVVTPTVSACSSGGDDGGGSEVSAGDAEGGATGPVKDDGKRRELDAGDGGATTAGEIVATSADEWTQKWTESGATASAPDVSAVDFENEVAVAIFAGERSSGGWRISPDVTVRIQGQFAAVTYEILGPGEGCTSTQAMTTPYLALAVKGSAVRFESSEREVPCED